MYIATGSLMHDTLCIMLFVCERAPTWCVSGREKGCAL